VLLLKKSLLKTLETANCSFLTGRFLHVRSKQESTLSPTFAKRQHAAQNILALKPEAIGFCSATQSATEAIY